MEGLGDIGPSPFLRATHRDDHLGLLLDHNRGVEDAVLLGADELFAVEEKDRDP
jgi:hypothetical protein